MAGSSDSCDFDKDNDLFELMLANARNGDADSIGKILEQCRNYLLLIANQDMDKNLQRKLGASDLVQESMMSAQAHFNRFDGTTKEQLLRWLRGILVNDVRHWHRHFKGTEKRGVHREIENTGSQQVSLEPSDALHTPSTQAATEEEEAMLLRAIKSLPENYQQVIQLRNWDDKAFSEIGAQLGCSGDAARKLWSRAIVRLQDALARDWPELDPDILQRESES